MKSFSPPNLLSRSLIGAVGLGVALLGLPQSASSSTLVNRGTDYLVTPSGGAVFNFVDPLPGAGVVTVNFGGLAIGTPTATPPDGGYLGIADTVVNRLDDVDATPTGGTTLLEIVGLSLKSVAPVTIGGANYDVFAGLQKYLNGTTSTGEMTIRDTGGANGKTWDSSFTINGVAIVAAAGTLIPTGTDYVKGLIQGCGTATNYQCILFDKGPFVATNEPWSDVPSLGQLQGANLVQPGLEQNFYLTGTAIHDAGNGIIHTVQPQPVPEPTILGSLAALGFGAALQKKWGKKNQKDQSDFSR
jgi:hypothetical protein